MTGKAEVELPDEIIKIMLLNAKEIHSKQVSLSHRLWTIMSKSELYTLPAFLLITYILTCPFAHPFLPKSALFSNKILPYPRILPISGLNPLLLLVSLAV